MTPPPTLPGLAALAGRYDLLFCDVWGVVHDGTRAYDAANDALVRFRAGGGRVVLLTNAPIPSEVVARLLDRRAVARDAWDAIVSSGDLVRREIRARGVTALHHIGPDRDLPLYDGLNLTRVTAAEADIAVVTGLVDDRRETGESYRPLLDALRARDVELICANPDRVVAVGDALLRCAGAVAEIFETIGGRVLWAGKPCPPIYAAARDVAAALIGTAVADARILCVGDSVATDLKGAADAGLDALFVGTGIHQQALVGADAAALGRLLAGHAVVATLPRLMW